MVITFFTFVVFIFKTRQLIFQALQLNISANKDALENIKHASSDRRSNGNKDHNFYNRGRGIKPVVENIP